MECMLPFVSHSLVFSLLSKSVEIKIYRITIFLLSMGVNRGLSYCGTGIAEGFRE